MSYTPTTWATGDTITASAMNKIENGIANAGGALIVGTDDPMAEAGGGGTLDKTFSEIYNALKSGTPVYVKSGSEVSGPSSDYSCGMGLLPVLCAIKYNDTFRVYVESKELGRINGNYYAGTSEILTFGTSSASGYPSLTNIVVPSQATDIND